MADWRDGVEADRPGIGLGSIPDGEDLEVTFLDEGSLIETEHGQALRVGVTVEAYPDGYSTMDDSAVGEGEDYNLITSSSRFKFALKEFAESITGESATVTAHGNPDSFDRTYTVD